MKLSEPWSWAAFVPGGVIHDPAGLAVAVSNAGTYLGLKDNLCFLGCFVRAIVDLNLRQYSHTNSMAVLKDFADLALESS